MEQRKGRSNVWFPQNELWGDRKLTTNAPQRVPEGNYKHETISGTTLPSSDNYRA